MHKKRKVLTKSVLEWLKPHSVLDTGMVSVPEKGNYKWIAKRGGYHDWAIYWAPMEWESARILAIGDKILDKELIKTLVPCDEEAFNLYRF